MTIKFKWINVFIYALFFTFFLEFTIFLIIQIFLGEESFSFKKLFTKYLELPIVLFIVILILLFGAIALASRFIVKSNIAQLYELLPDLKVGQSKAKDVERLSEQIHSLTDDKAKEIFILTERENYRREYLGNVSHELKTPLFSIQGYLLTLIEGGMNDKKIKNKYLNRINKLVERLTYIVNDLDLISELESGTLQLNQQPFNIVALIQEIFDLLEFKAENNKIKLDLEVNTHQSIRVIGDIERLEQVLTNLLVNAINYAGKESQVSVAIVPNNDKVKIIVKDTGIGIKPEHINRIFERFYRADKSRSRANGGSGLGLSIVKHILDAHGEKIFVESTYGEGTTFYFELKKA